MHRQFFSRENAHSKRTVFIIQKDIVAFGFRQFFQRQLILIFLKNLLPLVLSEFFRGNGFRISLEICCLLILSKRLKRKSKLTDARVSSRYCKISHMHSAIKDSYQVPQAGISTLFLLNLLPIQYFLQLESSHYYWF